MNYGKKSVLEKQKALNAKSSKWGKKAALIFLKVFLILFVCVGVIGIFGAFGIVKGIIDTSPDISQMTIAPTRFSTFIYDSEGNQTAKLVASDSNRIPVTMDKIPRDLANAFVAIEDERFYEHNGIDIKGIIRAFMVGLKNGGKFSEGASTITQQLLKNLVFTNWVHEEGFAEKLKRKIQEQYLAIQLEKETDKNTILVNYMNTINLGQNTLGVQAASLRYFNKQVYELNLSECAVIAGITKNPSLYNPITNPDENAKRRSKVLNNMLDQGYITQNEYNAAVSDDPYSRIKITNEVIGDTTITSYFDDAVTEQVYQDLLTLGYSVAQANHLLYSGGLKIYSTQNPAIQAICDEEFSNPDNYPADTRWLLSYQLSITKANGETKHHSSEMFRSYFRENGKKNFNLLYNSQEEAYADIAAYQDAVMEYGDEILDEAITLTPQPQVTIVIEDQSTGHVVAMIGGRGTKEGSRTLNRATDSYRSPGSTFKIVAGYAPALDTGQLTLASVQNDAPFNYHNNTPVSNWDHKFQGLVNLREGIYESLNIVAVKTVTQITPQLGFDYANKLGITSMIAAKEIDGKVYSDIEQSIVLGGLTKGVSTFDLNSAYATIANMGVYIPPKLYTKVVDSQGNIILDNSMSNQQQVIKETTSFLLTNAMQDVVTKPTGTGVSVNFGGMPIAGKTGTSSDYVDVWFAGYTPYYTATTWAGVDNNAILRKGTERNLAKSLWKKIMSRIHADLPSKSFETPAGIVQATVCSRSGKLPIAGLCDHTLYTEYFAEGTVPTASCNVHYQGSLCSYSQQAACTTCPFKVDGIFELTPPEHPSLLGGSSISNASSGQDGGLIYCPHNEIFMADPNAQALIIAHWNEIQARNQAAIDAGQVPPPTSPEPPILPLLPEQPIQPEAQAPSAEEVPPAEQQSQTPGEQQQAPNEQQQVSSEQQQTPSEQQQVSGEEQPTNNQGQPSEP